MSDSEEQYTVVDELEEGEIVETVPSKTVLPSQSKKRKSNDVSVNSSENDNLCHHHKKKKSKCKDVEIPKRYRSPKNDKASFGGVLSPKQTHCNPKKISIPAKSISRKKNVPCDFVSPSSKPKTLDVPRRNGHILREQSNPNASDNSVPQLDLNSSYDDLLKHHMAIQKALLELKKEHKKSKKGCPHKTKKNRSSSKTPKKSPSENSKKIVRVIENCKKAEPISKVLDSQPAVVQPELSNKIEVVILDNRSHKSTSKTQPDRSKDVFESSSNIIVSMQDDNELCESKNQDDELDLLRLNALKTVSPKDIHAKESVLENSGSGEKKALPNVYESSSAFSVSGSCDNYLVIDMEVDDDNTFSSSLIEVSNPQCSQTHLSDDDDIALMREQLLLSLNKSNVSKLEPCTATVSLVNSKISENCDHSKSPHSESKSEVKPQFSETPACAEFPNDADVPEPDDPCTGVDLHRVQCPDSLTVAVDNSVLSSETCSISFSSPPSICETDDRSTVPGGKSVELFEKSVPVPQSLSDNQPALAISSIVPPDKVYNKTQVPSTKFLPKAASVPLDPWVFMKQKPVIINLEDDSSDSESSECESEKKVPIFDSIDELIRSEKMKTTNKQVGSCEEETDKIESEDLGNFSALVTFTAKQSTKPVTPPISVESLAPGAVTIESGSSVAKVAAQNTRVKALKASAELIHEYKLLKRKLELTSDILQKETQVMAMRKIIANKKKSAFINSQIVTQRLKEQLVAAEKVRKTNMKMMFAANTQLEDIQGSVLKRTLLLKQMREQHQKLEEQISSNVPFPLDVILASE